MLNIVICEDEKNIQDLIESQLQNILKDLDYKIQKYSSGEDLLNSTLDDIDILLLDIQMGNINGMDAARKIRSTGSKMEIIFITSLIDYIKDGYEVRAYRYLLKPIDEGELRKSIISLVKEIDENRDNYIALKSKTNTYKIRQKEIVYIEVYKKYIKIHTISREIDFKYSLEKIEKDLNSYKFIRCHKSFLVNLDYIESISPYVFKLENKEDIPVSKHRYKDVKLKFYKFLGDKIC